MTDGFDVVEHMHGRRAHTHAWGTVPHDHMARQVCRRPECDGYPTHNIHPAAPGGPIPKAPAGWVALRVHDGAQKLIPTGAACQVTHLIRDTGDGRSKSRVTACGLTRFDTSIFGRTVPADLPGWSVGGSSVSGPNVVQEHCVACWLAVQRPAPTARGLTVRQPWASLIAEGAKTIETRSFPTSYRGLVLIHAGAARIPRYDPRELPPRVGDWSAWRRGNQDYDELLSHADGWIDMRDSNWRPMPYGRVVAIAHLVDCLPVVDPDSDAAQADGRYLLPAPVLSPTLGGLRIIDQTTVPGVSTTSTITDLHGQEPYGDYTPGRYGWVLANVYRVERPPRAKGRLGLWKPSTQLLREVQAGLTSYFPEIEAACWNPNTTREVP